MGRSKRGKNHNKRTNRRRRNMPIIPKQEDPEDIIEDPNAIKPTSELEDEHEIDDFPASLCPIRIPRFTKQSRLSFGWHGSVDDDPYDFRDSVNPYENV